MLFLVEEARAIRHVEIWEAYQESYLFRADLRLVEVEFLIQFRTGSGAISLRDK